MALDLVDETPLPTAVAKILAVSKKDSTYVFKGIQAAVCDGPCNDTGGFMLFTRVTAVGEGNQRPTGRSVVPVTTYLSAGRNGCVQWLLRLQISH